MYKGAEPKLPDDFTSSFEDFDVYGDKDAKTAIVTYGRLFAAAANAVNRLKQKGVSVKCIKLNKIKPIAENAVSEAVDCSHVIFYEESEQNGGAGEIFNLMLANCNYSGKFILRAVNNEFVHHSTAEELLREYGFDEESMTDFVSEVIEKNE